MTCHVCNQYQCTGSCMDKILKRPVAKVCDAGELCLQCPDAPQPKVQFPTMLRKMWTGAEVQAWLDEHVNKEPK